MNGVNRGIFRLLPVFLLLFLGVSSCSQKEERRILVIHSYEETYAAYPEFNRMIAEQFEKEKIDADIRTVYLDCESYWEEPELERMRFLVDSVSKDWRPEVILVNEDSGYLFIDEMRNSVGERSACSFWWCQLSELGITETSSQRDRLP